MKTEDQKVLSKDWEDKRLKPLRILVKGKKNIKHISWDLLCRIKDIREKVKKIKVVTNRGKKVEISEKVRGIVSASIIRENVKEKEMARAARKIARANGKRITMVMFFIEDLKD